MEPSGFLGVDIMFTIVPIIIGITFIFIFGGIIYSLISVAKDKSKPIIPVRAKIVSKRNQVRGGHMSHDEMSMHSHTSTHYYATFEMENGERMELSIPSHQIGYLVEGDTGILSFQGSLFVKFDRI